MIGADADQFQIYMRKVGYSVGLENTLSRLSDLCDRYIRDGTVTPQSWKSLVSDEWNLKNDGIGDFFGSLNLIKRTKSRLDVLSGLDLCAISRKVDPANAVLAGALLLLLMEMDGEIFLNALAGGFENDDLVQRLSTLVHYKRHVLFGIYRAPEIQSQLARVVGIDRQATNIGGAGKTKGLSGSKRTEPLESRTESLRGPALPEVEISDDYLRKVVPRRRDWAASIGLWDVGSHKRTPQGERLIEALAKSGLTLHTGEVVLWPLSHEVSRLRINPTLFGTRIFDFWELVMTALIGIGAESADRYDEVDRNFFVTSAQAHVRLYRELNRPKAMLRRELPLTIAYFTIGAAFFKAGKPVPNLPAIIEDERQRSESPLEIRTSRNSIGTLAVRGR